MARSARESIATIDQFIAQVGRIKSAADGKPLSEPGSIGGETDHPVKSVDDRLHEAEEGERSQENSADVREDQGPASVEARPEAPVKNAYARAAAVFALAGRFAKRAEGGPASRPGSASEDHVSSNMTVTPTGEDPAHETESAKPGKDDKREGGVGGTSHPASTENDELDGHKYAGELSLHKLAADMRAVGNNLLAQIHNVYVSHGLTAPQFTPAAAATAAKSAADLDPWLAYAVGDEMAGLVNGTMDKSAADRLVHATLTEIVKTASEDADLFIEYANNFLKEAAGDEAAAAAGLDGLPPELVQAMVEEAAAGAGPSEDTLDDLPPELVQALVEEAAAGEAADAPAPEENEAALLADLAGDDAGGGASGLSPEEEEAALLSAAAEEEGAGGGDDATDQLAAALDELGVTPEEVAAAAAASGGGGMEAQAADVRPGKSAAASKQAEVANYIREIVSRSRARR